MLRPGGIGRATAGRSYGNLRPLRFLRLIFPISSVPSVFSVVNSSYFNKYPNCSRALRTTSWLGALTLGNLSRHS